jgi:hypothetical protein
MAAKPEVIPAALSPATLPEAETKPIVPAVAPTAPAPIAPLSFMFIDTFNTSKKVLI